MNDVAWYFYRALPRWPRRVSLRSAGSALGVRLASLVILGGVLVGLAAVGAAAWHAMRDSFIAPLSLSADSAVVLENTLRLTELELERTRSVADADAAAAEASDADEENARLQEVERTLVLAGPWGQATHTDQRSASVAEVNSLAMRQSLLAKMIDKQRRLADLSLRNLQAGVISQTEYEQETLRLDQLTLSAMETARARVQSAFALKKARLGKQALDGSAPPLPEMVAREDLRVRIEVQRLRAEGRKRAKLAERSALMARVQKIDALLTQLKRNPLFHAAEAPLDLAFVPYSQLDGVSGGATVLRCRLVVFACRKVGSIAEFIPGEVVQPDPWGKVERGQYVALELTDRTAARAKTLRVRP